MPNEPADGFQGQASIPSIPNGASMVGFERSSIQLQPTSPLLEIQSGHNLAEPWYEGTSSSLNWLPYNWSPDFQVGVGNTFGSPDIIQSPESGRGHLSSSSDFEGTDRSVFTQYQTPPEPHRHTNQVLMSSEINGDHGSSSPGSHSNQNAGHYYIDGDGARLPRVRKVLYRIAEPASPLRDETRHFSSPFSFPNLEESLHINNSYDTNLLSLAIYEEILKVFKFSCVTSMHYSRFSAPTFPSLSTFSLFMHLFNQNFRSILPFIHPATFNPTRSHWLLILALAAAGSHFVGNEESRLYSLPMHEFLRRAIQVVVRILSLISTSHPLT